MFIDKMNNSTKIVNRVVNLSSAIYIVEKNSTFAEINNTTHENLVLMLSATSVNISGVELIDNIDHSNK
jgi:hypothetical protein